MNEFIKDMRISMMLTQSELSQLLGISVDTIKSWESGRRIPSQKMIKKIKYVIETYSPSEELKDRLLSRLYISIVPYM